MKEPNDDFSLFLYLLLLGFATGIGRLFVSDEKITTRKVIGEPIMNTVLIMSSYMGTVFIPQLTEFEQFGLACVIGSLGSLAIRGLIAKWFGFHKPH